MSIDGLQSEVASLEAAYIKNYTKMQYHWVQFFSEHVSDSSRQFGGDLQMMLVLAIVGQCALEQFREQRLGDIEPQEVAGISASSLADITGIPRQTVRRKLQALAAKGWIAQNSDGSWAIVIDSQGSPAARDLHELDRRGIRRIARLSARLSRLVLAEDEPIAAKPSPLKMSMSVRTPSEPGS
jgi:hypothetical protein